MVYSNNSLCRKDVVDEWVEATGNVVVAATAGMVLCLSSY